MESNIQKYFGLYQNTDKQYVPDAPFWGYKCAESSRYIRILATNM